jgi:uncharacterized protein involved in high-affinity Fe2+ transport
MRGLKSFIIVASVVATAASVAACRKEVPAEPMKLGAVAPVADVAR